ncbi:MAG: replicative DNA helicase [Clostridiales Family XIII bacterium]|jgi:replicative DNA helicase|nr:replicative DNA helicase [Clostridiales Family XIII bacterium]
MPERIPPHSEEAEQSILGAALQNESAMKETVETLRGDDFYMHGNTIIFDAIKELYQASRPVDLTTVTEILKRIGMFEACGGMNYLATLSDIVPSPSNARHYADLVREKAMLRRLIEAADEMRDQGYRQEDEADAVLIDAEKKILAIAQRGREGDVMPIKDVLNENIRRIEELSKIEGNLTGVPTGFSALDKYTLGLQRSEMVVLAARPGQGKTSLALNIALNAAEKADAKVLVFSLEMSTFALGQRLLSSEAEIESTVIRNGSVFRSDDGRRKIIDAVNRLSEISLSIEDNKTGLTISQIRNTCRRYKARQGGLDLVVVDYLQLIDFGGSGRSSSRPENRQQEVTTISRNLKQLAMEMECPVLVLSQLSRAVETRGQHHRPVLSDLRESGAIEQDADVVLFIYQRTRGDDDEGPDPEATRALAIAKNRNGETGEITLRWIGKFTKFLHYDPGVDQFI